MTMGIVNPEGRVIEARVLFEDSLELFEILGHCRGSLDPGCGA
jgi:hypothetical protein